MDKILIFNNDTDRREVYYRGESKPVPYNTKSEDDIWVMKEKRTP